MKKGLHGFTLVEILISMSILLVIISIVSVSIIQINSSIYSSQKEVGIFDNINTFGIESYQFKGYQSGVILTNSIGFPAVMLYNESRDGVIIGVFNDNSLGYNYQLSRDNLTFGGKKFGYFSLQDFQVQNILNATQDLSLLQLNDGKIYNNLDVNNLVIKNIGSGNLFQLEFELLKSIPSSLEGYNKTEYFIDKDNILEINIVI